MPGAPNCQYPPWTDAEKEIVGRAWDIAEAWENYSVDFGDWIRNPDESRSVCRYRFEPTRTFKAIVCEWLRLHPILPNRNTHLDQLLKQALDELEAMG